MPNKKKTTPSIKQRFPELHRKYKDLSSTELMELQTAFGDQITRAENRITRATAEIAASKTDANNALSSFLVIKGILAAR